VAAARGTGDNHAAGGTHVAGGKEIVNPPRNDPRFKRGTTGPTVPEGRAPTVKIPDGRTFDGREGREQNDDDKKQNNYSVTDANFNPRLGLMASNPDTGKELNYVQHIQTYNAAGYIQTFATETWDRLVDAQNKDTGKEGGATVLEGASYLMGLVKTRPTWLQAAGITGADIPRLIPGTNRDAREYIAGPKDARGNNWARMHHPESAWDIYKSVTDLGVRGEQALRLASDDGVSGAGRVNGMNNQDGGNGFNAGEVEVWKEAAQLERSAGLPIIQAMMSGHDHADLDASALTNPAMNDEIGFAANVRSATPARAAALRDALLAGRLDENNGGGGGGGRADGDAAGEAGGGRRKHNLPALNYRAPRYSLDAAALAGDHGPQPRNPARTDGRFANGTVGPTVKEGEAPTVKVPDGKGFFGLAGRKQNDNDKKQNNYSVTDANFNPVWGLLAGQDGKPLNYVMQIQLYHAAAYLKTFSPEMYALLVQMQDAGGLTVLEAAGAIMGLFDAPEAADLLGAAKLSGIQTALQQAGIGAIGTDPRIPAKIPGTNMDAKTYVTTPKDATGQEWARMHHPESAMEMLKNLLEAGVPAETAFVLAGDDAVSGAGRLNGYNNQDGNDSFNADEAAVYRNAAEYERTSGIPVIQIMMSGHDHTYLDPSAKTTPNINKILGLAKGDVSASPQRAAALAAALLGNADGIDIADLGQHAFKNDDLRSAMTGAIAPLAARQAAAGAALVAAAGGVPSRAAAPGPAAAGAVPAAHGH